MASSKKFHVLVVDDNAVERIITEKLLKSFDCQATTAEDGIRAMEFLGLGNEPGTTERKESKVDMIITDYCMPGMTGYELLKKVKESPTMKDIPVVIVSSNNIPERINKCLEEGALEYMLKPLQKSAVEKLRCLLKELQKLV